MWRAHIGELHFKALKSFQIEQNIHREMICDLDSQESKSKTCPKITVHVVHLFRDYTLKKQMFRYRLCGRRSSSASAQHQQHSDGQSAVHGPKTACAIDKIVYQHISTRKSRISGRVYLRFVFKCRICSISRYLQVLFRS